MSSCQKQRLGRISKGLRNIWAVITLAEQYDLWSGSDRVGAGILRG